MSRVQKPSQFTVTTTGYRCRCGHEWFPRNKSEKPRVCPKCKSANWDKPYKYRKNTI